MCLEIGLNLITKRKVYIFSHFEPLSMRCELTVMPLDRVLGCDRVVSKLWVYDLDGNLFKFFYGDS